MKYHELLGIAKRSNAKLLSFLEASVTEEGGYKGAGQFVFDGKSEHVGLYGTTALVEALLANGHKPENNDIDEYFRFIKYYVSQEGGHFERDVSATIKLSVTINAIKCFPHEGKYALLLDTLIDKLYSMRIEKSGKLYWRFSKSEPDPEEISSLILPTAYALIALSDTKHATSLTGAVEFLSEFLRDNLESGGRTLDAYENLYSLAAIDKRTDIRRNYLSDSEITQLDYFLYAHLIKDDTFDEEFINFVVTEPEFSSMFYVVKTDLGIIKYFLEKESDYLSSKAIAKKIRTLFERIEDRGSYVSRKNGQSSIRENSVAILITKLFEAKASKIKVSSWYDFYLNYIKWYPIKSRSFGIKRVLMLLVIFGILGYSIWKWGSAPEFLLSVLGSIIASAIYENLRGRK